MILDAKRIIDGGHVEDERIEYKRDWNPEPILHTLCAFANDIDNQSGGYIIIGIEERGGRPARVPGVAPDAVDGMNAKLMNLCNLIDPRYLVESEYCPYEDQGVLVIRAPGGWNRPYKCPVSLSEKKSEKGYYIRKMGSTIRANSSEEKELFRISEVIPFDDRTSMKGHVSDLKYGLMMDFLAAVNSRMTESAKSMSPEALADSLHVVNGPAEDRRPVNVGLMFFNDRPEDFFRFARIEIVYKPDPTGIGMDEHIVTGPLDKQLRDALSFIENNYIREYVTKVSDRPDAVRAFNYPMAAVEEALSNAVYHKGYDVAEPITVYIYPDRMEITSAPGPDRSISDDDLRKGILISRTYRNRRIGEFLKDLDLAEGRNTGVPLMKSSLASNGSEPPRFLTDADRSYMTVVIPVNRHFMPVEDVRESGRTHAETTTRKRSAEDIARNVLSLLEKNGEMSMRELSDAMGYGSVPSSLRNVVSVLMVGGSVEYTLPESPRAPNQRIRLTGRGGHS